MCVAQYLKSHRQLEGGEERWGERESGTVEVIGRERERNADDT